MPSIVKIYAIAAQDAPILAVFRRAPGKWTFLYRWDLVSGELEVGAALHGNIFPRRCDVSPSGELLYYFAFKHTSKQFLDGTSAFSAVSKLPWLYALAAWRESGTWSRGCHFVDASQNNIHELGTPDYGDDAPLRRNYRLVFNKASQYGVERRRGWVEHDDCPPRDPSDVWDEARAVILAKSRPGGRGRLILTDRGYQPDMGFDGRYPAYQLEMPRRTIPLTDATWADWDNTGRLLMATAHGRLRICDADHPNLHIIREHLVTKLKPGRRPAPAWAQRWSP